MADTDNGGEVLATIDRLLQGEDEIPTQIALRLILAAVRDANRAIRDVKKTQKIQQDQVDDMKPWVDLSKWMAAAIGLEIVGLIWAIVTHRVELGW